MLGKLKSPVIQIMASLYLIYKSSINLHKFCIYTSSLLGGLYTVSTMRVLSPSAWILQATDSVVYGSEIREQLIEE